MQGGLAQEHTISPANRDCLHFINPCSLPRVVWLLPVNTTIWQMHPGSLPRFLGLAFFILSYPRFFFLEQHSEAFSHLVSNYLGSRNVIRSRKRRRGKTHMCLGAE